MKKNWKKTAKAYKRQVNGLKEEINSLKNKITEYKEIVSNSNAIAYDHNYLLESTFQLLHFQKELENVIYTLMSGDTSLSTIMNRMKKRYPKVKNYADGVEEKLANKEHQPKFLFKENKSITGMCWVQQKKYERSLENK